MPRVLERAQAAVTKIEAGMAWAQRTGVLHEFNQEYRRHSKRKGEASGSWVTGRRRRDCGRAITKVAATGTAPVAIVQKVFRR